MALHRLYAYPQDFEPILEGRKSFGVIGLARLDPAVGDTLVIEEVWRSDDKQKPRSTGRAVRRVVTYCQYAGFGIEKGFVAVSFVPPVTRTRTRTR